MLITINMNRYFNYKVNVSLPGIQNCGLTKYMNFLNTGEGTSTMKVKVVGLGNLRDFRYSK